MAAVLWRSLRFAGQQLRPATMRLLTPFTHSRSRLLATEASQEGSPTESNLQRQELIVPPSTSYSIGRINTFPLGRKLTAVVELSGHQYSVSTNDVVITNKLRGLDVGDTILIDKVLMAFCHDYRLIGQPYISSEYIKVYATVVEQTKAEKKIIFKFRRRKNSQRTRGHRQQITCLRIGEIVATGF